MYVIADARRRADPIIAVANAVDVSDISLYLVYFMVYLNISDGVAVNDKIFTFFRLLLIMKSVSVKVLFAFAVLLTAAAVGSVSAYVINFEAPSEISSGDSFVLSGTSTLPEGFSGEVIVYKKAQVGNKRVGSFPFVIGGDGTWTLIIDTAGWDAGLYNLDLKMPENSDYSLGGSSDLAFTFTVTEPKVAATTSSQSTASTPEQTSAVTSAPTTATGSQPAATVSTTPAPAAKTSPAAVWTAILGLAAVAGAFAVCKRE